MHSIGKHGAMLSNGCAVLQKWNKGWGEENVIFAQFNGLLEL